jgi:hypothetical protein
MDISTFPGGHEMRAFIGALILSILSASVGLFASTELQEMVLAAGGSFKTASPTSSNINPAASVQQAKPWRDR